MQKTLVTFWKNEGGQDLVEYTLLVGFIMLAGAALVIANGGGIQGILFVTTNNLNAANTMAS